MSPWTDNAALDAVLQSQANAQGIGTGTDDIFAVAGFEPTGWTAEGSGPLSAQGGSNGQDAEAFINQWLDQWPAPHFTFVLVADELVNGQRLLTYSTPSGQIFDPNTFVLSGTSNPSAIWHSLVVSSADPVVYPLIHEQRSLHTPEWQALDKSGTGEDGILQIEWDPVNDTIRVSGPVVLNNPPHAPAR